MTEKQFREKLSQLLIPLVGDVMGEALKVFRSGAIDPRDYKDDFILPKCVLNHLFKTREFYTPVNEEMKKIEKALRHH